MDICVLFSPQLSSRTISFDSLVKGDTQRRRHGAGEIHGSSSTPVTPLCLAIDWSAMRWQPIISVSFLRQMSNITWLALIGRFLNKSNYSSLTDQRKRRILICDVECVWQVLPPISLQSPVAAPATKTSPNASEFTWRWSHTFPTQTLWLQGSSDSACERWLSASVSVWITVFWKPSVVLCLLLHLHIRV